MNINNINVNKYPISQEELFNDLMENDAGYFLGSIICINTTQDTLNNPKFEVVDGQQRLTTLSLLLAALYVTLDANRDKLDEDQQSDILQLKRKLVLKKTQSDIRIVPQVQNKNLGFLQIKRSSRRIRFRSSPAIDEFSRLTTISKGVLTVCSKPQVTRSLRCLRFWKRLTRPFLL